MQREGDGSQEGDTKQMKISAGVWTAENEKESNNVKANSDQLSHGPVENFLALIILVLQG